MTKERLDIAMVGRGLAITRQKAQGMILSGLVSVDGQRADKPGMAISSEAVIELRSEGCPFVSRGGYKLEKAVELFGLKLRGRICADIGASTGGFTDCMLQNGAKHVFSVDVGYGQLDWRLRSDSRVTVMERTNARYLTSESFSEPVEFASVDVSFISLGLIFPALAAAGIGEVVTLIKPQFEAGKEKVGKNGVVREKSTHIEVIKRIIRLASEQHYYADGLGFSPIKGPKGNIEYIAHYVYSIYANPFLMDEIIEEMVEKAHETL